MMSDSVIVGVLLNIAVSLLVVLRRGRRDTVDPPSSTSSYDQLIGNTPMIKLNKLSLVLGCNVFAKVR